jgi:hypothetical protein
MKGGFVIRKKDRFSGVPFHTERSWRLRQMLGLSAYDNEKLDSLVVAVTGPVCLQQNLIVAPQYILE